MQDVEKLESRIKRNSRLRKSQNNLELDTNMLKNEEEFQKPEFVETDLEKEENTQRSIL